MIRSQQFQFERESSTDPGDSPIQYENPVEVVYYI